MDTSIRIKVDHSISLEKMIEAGDYDEVSEQISSKNFPRQVSEKVVLEIRFFTHQYDPSTEQVEGRFERDGVRPVTLEELIQLSVSSPDLIREGRRLPALGSRCFIGKKECVPVLSCFKNKRELYLRESRFGWTYFDHFAVVEKGS